MTIIYDLIGTVQAVVDHLLLGSVERWLMMLTGLVCAFI